MEQWAEEEREKGKKRWEVRIVRKTIFKWESAEKFSCY
jgi:hypothetical protein